MKDEIESINKNNNRELTDLSKDINALVAKKKKKLKWMVVWKAVKHSRWLMNIPNNQI